MGSLRLICGEVSIVFFVFFCFFFVLLGCGVANIFEFVCDNYNNITWVPILYLVAVLLYFCLWSNQVTFIFVVLYTIEIIPKPLHMIKVTESMMQT